MCGRLADVEPADRVGLLHVIDEREGPFGMEETASPASRGQRWLVALLTLPAVFVASWVLMSLAAWVTPAFWTWGREPTAIEWLIRVIYLAIPFAITGLVGWRMYRWIMRAERRE